MMTPPPMGIYEMNYATEVILSQLSNIPASAACGVYFSQLIRYFRVCNKYGDFRDRGQLLSQKLLKESCVAPTFTNILAKNILRSTSQSSRPLKNIHISISNGSFTFYVDVFFPLPLRRLLLDLTV